MGILIIGLLSNSKGNQGAARGTIPQFDSSTREDSPDLSILILRNSRVGLFETLGTSPNIKVSGSDGFECNCFGVSLASLPYLLPVARA